MASNELPSLPRPGPHLLLTIGYDFLAAVARLERWLQQHQAQQAKKKPPTTSHS